MGIILSEIIVDTSKNVRIKNGNKIIKLNTGIITLVPLE